MKCNEVHRVLPEMLEGGQDGEFLAHVESCPACGELVSDLKLISAAAAQLAESEEPAPRIWVRIAAELRSEGLIREPEFQPDGPVLVPTKRHWDARWLVPVAAALVAVSTYVINHRQVPPTANQQAASQQPTVTAPIPKDAPDPSAQVRNNEVQNQKPAEVATNRKPSSAAAPSVAPSGEEQDLSAPFSAPTATVSLDDQQFLDQVSGRSPEMKATYEIQLRSVNSYIQDAETYLKRNPADADARRHLMQAYEQKAMLYQMALDNIQ
jgi:hypothetical protein